MLSEIKWSHIFSIYLNIKTHVLPHTCMTMFFANVTTLTPYVFTFRYGRKRIYYIYENVLQWIPCMVTNIIYVT